MGRPSVDHPLSGIIDLGNNLCYKYWYISTFSAEYVYYIYLQGVLGLGACFYFVDSMVWQYEKTMHTVGYAMQKLTPSNV